ncbi:3-oxoacyl-ACP synthase [Pseudonocardia acidicola]|uniref:3-oxoacyl-ACP synthase n=1 Tax=Pseudonocardia acidicola TaxID=2724939 RepID=A0ABX1SA67_9PSEU|nr:3-oxoacyl-ACP synthase [Pseudonocardia acidicola]NMH98454.1 3-oxoacyl-ACP synthase [Pseudonocardia acidicola]
MGTVIEATATAIPGGDPAVGAVYLVDAAARACLERAHRAPDDVQLLINAGVYLDRNISEPAIASLIQEDIDANPEPEPGGGQGTLSFDVRNGACGLLTGIELVHGLLASGTIEAGMVVATDADPEPGQTEGFGFPPVGGAILLSTDAAHPGFTGFRFATFPEYGDRFTSEIDWRTEDGGGRNVLTVEIADDYPARALECAEATARELAAADGLDLREVGALVAAASTPGFAPALAERLGIPPTRAVPPPDGLASAHTAALAAALDSVSLPDAGTALLVSAGSGITVAAAVYRG